MKKHDIYAHVKTDEIIELGSELNTGIFQPGEVFCYFNHEITLKFGKYTLVSIPCTKGALGIITDDFVKLNYRKIGNLK